MRLFGRTNELIYVKALCMQQSLYVYVEMLVCTPMKNAKYSYFTLKRHIQVPTILGTKIYKGKKVSRKTDEDFHLIEPTGLYYWCKLLQVTHGSCNKVWTGCSEVADLDSRLIESLPVRKTEFCRPVSLLHKGLHKLISSNALEAAKGDRSIDRNRKKQNKQNRLIWIVYKLP